ncbi:kinase-like domain-containing protein [Rhizophagus clarus]|uniref:Kinase-like domain-containing protein n=1 Tax=Rhizophagus clarus TaxID=94130 RepID=A0A8H3QNV3_9GLOM|nr:kinase-like domain-containing protein [Rhizophagus clarus]
MSFVNENQLVSEFNELNISDKDSISLKITNHKNCYDPDNKKFWCKGCVPRCIIEGWTSGNDDIDNFIKDTIYNAGSYGYPIFLEWVPFDRFENLKQIGEGGFAKVYSATWIDGRAEYYKEDDGSWIKKEPKPIEVALKRLNGSQNMSADFLNELKMHWRLYWIANNSLKFYGMTKDTKTKEFMMIMKLVDGGNLRNILLSDFNNIMWDRKLAYLSNIAMDLKNLHSLGFIHKDFHSGNILGGLYISDFGLSGPSNEQKSDNKIFGVLPYIAPKVLNGEPYTLPSDIYSFGCWCYFSNHEKYEYKGFEEANNEIPNILNSYEKNLNDIYTSRAFTFKNLSKPINSSFIATSYLSEEDNEDCQDSQLIDLEVPNTLKFEEDNGDN